METKVSKKEQLQNLVKFKPNEGIISFDDQRMVLFQANAIAHLKEELIQTLGEDLACGVLMRFGYRCGFEDARVVLNIFGEEIKSIGWGPFIFKWKGMGKVVIEEEVEFDFQKEHYFLKGKWEQSPEVEHYIRKWGIGTKSVCWISAGYASGFASGFTGLKIYCWEKSCKGKGDSICSWEMRSQKSWGKQADCLEKYFNPKFDFKSLQVMIAEERSIDIHRKLTKLVLEEKGIEAIVHTVSEIINCSVIILNSQCKVITYSCKNKEIKGEDVVSWVERLSQQQIVKNTWKTIKGSSKIIKIEPIIEQGFKNPFFLSPIISSREKKGILIVYKDKDSELTEQDYFAIEHACTVCGLEFLKEKTAIEAEMRIKRDFLDDLIQIRPGNYRSIFEKALRFGYDLNEPHIVIVISFNNKEKANHDNCLHVMKEIESLINEIAPLSLIAFRRDILVIVLNTKNIHQKENPGIFIAKKVLQFLTLKHPSHSFNIGIGRKCINLRDYQTSYYEALRCVEIMEDIGETNSYKSFDDLGIYGLLWNSTNKKQLKEFAFRQLGELINYKKKHNINFLKTLDLYIKNNRNITKTAKDLYIHTTSLKYRLKRISELTGKDLSNEEVIFNFQICLHILKVFGMENCYQD